MIGHSLVSGVNWNAGIGRADIVNKGQPGEGIEQIRNRIETDVLSYNPTSCFLLSDYTPGNKNNSDRALQLLTEIYDLLKAKNIKLIVQSAILYSNTLNNFEELNANLNYHDERIQNWIDTENSDLLDYIDLNSSLSSEGYRHE